MKMPSRPWYPPLEPQADVFGLHHITLLGAAFESNTERRERIAKVEAGVIAAFNAAVQNLGEDEARRGGFERGPGRSHHRLVVRY